MEKNLEDFIAVYPNFDDPQIQTLLTNKKEFDELKAQVKEKPPKRGEYYLHQRYFIRFLRASDVVVNIQETGTGKTCAFVGAAEYFLSKNICRHIFILEKGPTTIYEMKNQILCKCTAGVYETEMVRKKEGAARKGNISRAIGKNYTIISYGNLVTAIKDLSDDQIINQYSGCFYIMDEAHNLANSGIKHHSDPKSLYSQLHRFFHVIKRSKIALCTATPMINEVKEIVPIMNLILPLDNQMPYNVDYRFVTLSQVEPYFRGKVTFVRALDTGAKPVYRGEYLMDAGKNRLKYEIDVVKNKFDNTPLVDGMKKPETEKKIIESQVKVWPSQMGDLQEKVYDTVAKPINLEDIINSPEKDAIHLNEFFTSCFVFPDGSYKGNPSKGNEVHTSGLGKYIYSPAKDVYQFIDPPPQDFMTWPERGNHLTFKDWIYNNGNTDNLRRLSSKFAEIIDIEVLQNKPGCSFIYSEYVNGPTSIMLCMCFNAFGYEFYNESVSAFLTAKSDESICVEGKRTLRNNIKPEPRIFFLSPESESKRDSALELFCSRENMNGEYIAKVIGSKVSRDGINLYNCLRYHCLIPNWHPSGKKQAENRVFRSVSHDYLIEAEQEKLKDPNAIITIDVDIYYQAAISIKAKSIDLWAYRYAEEKDFYISQMMRYMKQCAVDCRTNYTRNVRHTDVDGSARCDYDVCNYACVTASELPDEENMDYSTYDILYTDEAIESCIDEICKLLQVRGSISYSDIITMYSPTIYRERVVYLAISSIIERKIKIVNRLGFECFIVSDGLILFTQMEYPSGTNVDPEFTVKDLSVYGQNLVSVETKTFSENKEILQYPYQEELWNKLFKVANPTVEPGYTTAINIIKSMIFETKMKLIEYSIIDVNSLEICVAVKHYYSSYIFETYEPVDNINLSKILFLENSKETPKLSPEKQSNNLVYLHTFKSSNIEATNYAELSRFMNNNDIRIYNPQEKLGWRDVLPYELPSYNKIITDINNEKDAKYDIYPWYGIILLDGKFLIKDRTDEVEETTKSGRKRGRGCSTTPMVKLLTYIVDAKISPPEFKNINVDTIRNNNINYFINKNLYTIDYLDKLSDDDLILLRKWESVNFSTSRICTELRKFLETHDRLRII